MSMVANKPRSIDFLLRKYSTKQPGEVFSSDQVKREYNNKKWRMDQKIRICKNICRSMNIKGTSMDRCIDIVKKIPLKDLHRRASCETIITCICFYVKKADFSNVKLSDYTVCKKYNVSSSTYMLVVTRLCDYYQKHSYI